MVFFAHAERASLDGLDVDVNALGITLDDITGVVLATSDDITDVIILR